MPTVECTHPIPTHASSKLVQLFPWVYVLWPIRLLFLEQLNAKDSATPQATPNNTLTRSGTILSKASALSHFSTYGKFAPVEYITLCVSTCRI